MLKNGIGSGFCEAAAGVAKAFGEDCSTPVEAILDREHGKGDCANRPLFAEA